MVWDISRIHFHIETFKVRPIYCIFCSERKYFCTYYGFAEKHVRVVDEGQIGNKFAAKYLTIQKELFDGNRTKMTVITSFPTYNCVKSIIRSKEIS